MALTLPLLLLIMGGVIDLGMLYWQQEVLTNACREGVRAGAQAVTDAYGNGRAAKTVTQVRTIVQDYLRKFKIKDAAGADITLTTANCLCTWDLSDPNLPTITVELRNIPRKMLILPNVQTFFDGGTITDVVYLGSRTTLRAEWTTPPS